MIDEEKVEEEFEPTPYSGEYRKSLLDADEEAEPDLSDLSEIENTQKQEGMLSKEQDHNWKKRYADLKSYHDRQKNEWTQERELIEAKSRLAEQSAVLSEMPKSLEEIEEFKREYPEVYGVVETVSRLQAEAKSEELEKRISALNQREEEARYKTSEAELLVLHPDFLDLKNDPEFLGWLEKQPETISNGIYKNRTDSQWAARIIDLYKLDSSTVNPKKFKSSKSAATAVTKTQKAISVADREDIRIWTNAEISKLKPHEFEKLESELVKASREGRII
jgi:hypothetical protein